MILFLDQASVRVVVFFGLSVGQIALLREFEDSECLHVVLK